MRLVMLALGALGPFPGEHVVDFDQLGASGLFLLEGATGAGKSTLIDAVVFALYGKVASAAASEERLRSAHASPDDETYVELTFSTGAGLFRVRRTPAYPRPKHRGSGTTTQQATVRVWRLTSPEAPGELLSNRLDEAGVELQRIVGLDRTQFVQTVVLPQGEFAEFLRADPEQRRVLLQKVFGTEVYDRVQQRLERMRADATRGTTQAEQTVARAVAHFVGSAGEVAGFEPDGCAVTLSEAEPAEAARLAEGVAEQLSAAAGAAAAALTRADAAVRSARAAREAQEAQAALIRRRDSLRGSLAVLDADAAARAEQRARLLAAQRAERLWPWVERSQRAATSVARASERHDEARAEASADLRELVGPGPGTGADAGAGSARDDEAVAKALDDEIEACVAARSSLVRALGLEAGLPARRADLASRTAAHAAAQAALEGERESLAELPAQRARWDDEARDLRPVAAGLGDARLALATERTRLAAARDVEALATRLAGAEQRVTDRVAESRAANATLAAAHEARIAGIAGELAQALVPGEPCVVCGSTTHPAPAHAAQVVDTQADQAEAEELRTAAERGLHEAVTSAELIRERLAAQRTAADGELAELELIEHSAQAAVESATAAEHRVAELVTAIAALDRELDERRTALEARARELAGDDARIDALRSALAADELEVLGAADGEPSVRARDDAWQSRVDEARAWAAALRALVEEVDRQGEADRERDVALREAGITADTVLRERLGPEESAALQHAHEAHVTELARVTGALAEPELADLPDQVDADALAAASDALEVAERTAATGRGDAAVLAERAEAARGAATDLVAAVDTLDRTRAAAVPVVRMANVATASGGEGALTLATYVLGQRFADLVAAANARLTTISDGRYELIRSSAREAVRTRRLGLAMQVLDHRTGTGRDPRTLSGGETFYVSLCLALGLADVVTAEAGGVELGTLLIDEGFGSLDAETLDVVLAELHRLREGGRVVGVVSHVETLKSAISERIEVRRRPDGASTLTVRA